jgi:Mg2+-importing ATPase
LPAALSATLLFRALSFWLPMVPGFFYSRRATAEAQPIAGRAAPADYGSRDPAEIAAVLGTSIDGLSEAEAARRLAQTGPNESRERRRVTRGWLLWKQLRSPLLLLLVFAAAVSAATGAWLDASIVLAIIAASVAIGYTREHRAEAALARLRSRIEARATVLRDGGPRQVPAREVVPGDVAVLSAGAIVPADGLLLQAAGLFVNEALLTGESFPAEKAAGRGGPDAGAAARRNRVFRGTIVQSGSARFLVVATGAATEIGAIAHRLALRPPETEFERGVRRFGYLLTMAMLAIVSLVFAINVALDRPLTETFLFSIALAVGLSPELLPAILSINLARGAQMMARQGVLVRSLNAIENLGSIDVLCTDKTGTLTEGVVRLDGAWDERGAASTEVARLAACNAALQTGLVNPLDDAILREIALPAGVRKVAEIPYDFARKRLSVVVQDGAATRLVTKGAFDRVLAACARLPSGQPLDAAARAALTQRFEDWARAGVRTLAVAERGVDRRTSYTCDDETGLTFVGFLTFLDRPRAGVREAIAALRALGVAVKVITGDNRLVAAQVAGSVGLPCARLASGRELEAMTDEALSRAAGDIDAFAEVDPNQKERIIRALRKSGRVVGFLGDGINDAPAMHAADASLSVDTAVDVARDAADFVLLERDLDVIRRGIEEGRHTFANTLKYVLMTTSANLGNMISMAIASLVLPFLPLLAGQILLNNFLSDVPAIGLATDRVDREMVERPRRWNMRFIGRFMLEFGLLSSLFDFATFAVLLLAFAADATLFRTGWFVESLLSELVIAMVIRTRRRCFRSRPGEVLLVSTAVVALLAVTLPYTPLAPALGFEPLPGAVLAAVVAITAAYALVTEFAKGRFFRDAESAWS